MPKEKKQIEIEKTKDLYIEIIATLLILLCLVLLSELGAVGILSKKLFLIIFGDFYFIIVIYLIINGIFTLLKGYFFNFHSIRFHGFIIFILSLLMLNHLSFISLFNISSGSILSDSLSIYKNALFSSVDLSSYGGGLIGAIMAQIFVVLFNRIGAIIFSIIFIIIGISFITNLNFRSLIYASTLVFKKIKSLYLAIYRYFSNINYPSKKEKSNRRDVLINLNLLNEINSGQNDILQQKISFDMKQILINYLYQNHHYISNEKMQCGYSYSRYIFNGNFYNLKVEDIEKIVGGKALIYHENDRLIIEVSNKIRRLLCLKTVLLNCQPTDIPIGLEINESIYNFNPLSTEHLLISGGYNSGITNFIKSFIISLIFRLKDKFNLIFFDYDNRFNEFKYFPNLYYPVIKKEEKFDLVIDELTYELEKRLKILHDFLVSDYLALNLKLKEEKKEEMKPLFVIVSDVNQLSDKGYHYEQKLLYFFKFAHKAGIHIIIIARNAGVPSSIISNIKTKMLFKSNSIEQSFEILNNKNACFLLGNGDSLLIQNNQILHLQIPYIAKDDFERIINKYILS